jgi:hypothetical protein
MSGESSASPNKMRYQQQKHSNHMKVGMDKKYPHLSQARLRSGKTFHSDDGSFLHPCSQYPHRASRVRSLSSTSLGPPSSPQQNSEPDPFGIQPCSAIHAPSFYQAFNRYSRALYLTRKENNIPIITAPLLFDLKGSLLDERHLKQLAKKGSLFEEMPSSCKDIRKLFPFLPNPQFQFNVPREMDVNTQRRNRSGSSPMPPGIRLCNDPTQQAL